MACRRCRFRFVDFLVNIWFKCDCDRLKPPLAVRLKRFAAPRFVFNLGITVSQNKCPQSVLVISMSFRRDDHHHLTPFHLGVLFDDTDFLEVGLHPL